MKHKLITITGWLFLLLSIGLLLYPEIISFIQQKESDQVVQKLEENMNREKKNDLLYQKSARYNDRISKNGQKDLKDVWSYNQAPIILRNEDRTFGYIKIWERRWKI